MWYYIKHRVILCVIPAIIVIAVVFFVMTHFQSSGAVDLGSSIIYSSEEVESPTPTDVNTLLGLLQSIESDTLKFYLSSEKPAYIVVDTHVNNSHSTYYLNYSSAYDCTVATMNMDENDGEEPFKIFYHYDFDDGKSLAINIVQFFEAYITTPTNNAHLVEGSDGSLSLALN